MLLVSYKNMGLCLYMSDSNKDHLKPPTFKKIMYCNCYIMEMLTLVIVQIHGAYTKDAYCYDTSRWASKTSDLTQSSQRGTTLVH